MILKYSDFLKCHNDLTTSKIITWRGNLYLPPCTCCTITSMCTEVSNKDKFDFSKHDDIDISSLIDVCKYIDTSVTTYKDKSIYLCKKYSLSEILVHVNKINNLKGKVQFIKDSEVFKDKGKLLKNDLKLLFPISGSSYVFKRRITGGTSIKYQIICNMGSCYTTQSESSSSIKLPRKCTTTKPIAKDKTCTFSINIHLDLNNLDWFVKWKGNAYHQHHHPTKLNEFRIGQHQLSTSMISEINKLHNSNVSSAIQQNVLIDNNDVSVPLMTILNKQYTERNKVLQNHTDSEELLATLKKEPNITYFAMYAKSVDTPLLTVKKTKRARNANNNNIKLCGYVKVYQDKEIIPVTPRIDSTLQNTLKQLLVKNKDTHEVEVLLGVGWARDEDLRVIRKFPEVVKMDCTFSTNREDRPLFNIVSKDSNGKLCTVMRCLLPSEKRAVFHTILNNVIPKVLGETTCANIKFVLTDGDSQEIEACKIACKSVFYNAQHMTCLWHMIHRSLFRTTVVHNPRLANILKHWLYFTATNVETKDEIKQSLTYMKVSIYYIILFSYINNSHHFAVFSIIFINLSKKQ